MITFFTTFRQYSRAEKNAVNSWLSLHKDIHVIVFTEASNTEGWIQSERVLFNRKFNRHESGLPLLNSVFEEASRFSKFPILCYCNSDIILHPDFLRRVKGLLSNSGFFLGVSQRIDLDLDSEIDFENEESVNEFVSNVQVNGKIHPPTGSDIFLHRQFQYTTRNMPDLVVGKPGWDNWMLYDARARFNKLIDFSGCDPLVIHQNHAFKYNSQNPLDQLNFRYLPANNLYTFVLNYSNYTVSNGDLRMRNSVRGVSMERIRWELIFNSRNVLYFYFFFLLIRAKAANICLTILKCLPR